MGLSDEGPIGRDLDAGAVGLSALALRGVDALKILCREEHDATGSNVTHAGSVGSQRFGESSADLFKHRSQS